MLATIQSTENLAFENFKTVTNKFVYLLITI